MSDQFTISDPDEFPVVFKFKRRLFRPYDAPTVSAAFAVDQYPVAAEVAAAVYRYDSQYGLDVDPFGDEVPSVPVGKKILFEATTNSSTFSASALIIKTWNSSSSFAITGSGQVGNVRQASSSGSITSSFYAGSSLAEFDAVRSGGVDYYPTVVPNIVATTFYDVDEGFQSFSVSPGSSTDKTMAAADNAGINWVWIAMTPEWYLNEARTISAASVPSAIDIDPVDLVVRLVVTKDGRFSQTSQIASDGSAFFTNIIRDADAEGQAQMSYVALDVDDDVFISTQENVRIDGNGLPIQTGNYSAVYLLDNEFPNPSFSSSNSNSFSSSSLSFSPSSSSSESISASYSSSSSLNGEVYATGGTVIQIGSKRIHTFTSDGNFEVINGGAVEVLVVAGGGGGAGSDGGGGGGAGGLIYDAAFAVSDGTISVTVGDGGAGTDNNSVPGANGDDSVFSTLTAVGGGGGGDLNSGGVAGGSGGGAGRDSNYAAGGTATLGQGYDGGITTYNSWASGGGGGGASEVGGDGGGDGSSPDDPAGAGGDGLAYDISGTLTYYAGGGGGAALNNTGGAGGLGGGGAGGSSTSGTAATVNTGGGGGGGRGGSGASGGSGIVIVSYTYQTGSASNSSSSQSAGGGCLQTLINTMGGITTPFCACYSIYGLELIYTPDQAGASGPGVGNEGWTVGGTPAGFLEPEIFCFMGTWYLYDTSSYHVWSAFINATDGCGGINFSGTTVDCCD